jgi:hypothetical protein
MGTKGLSPMRERAERFSCRLSVWSRSLAGPEIELSVPGHVAFSSETADHSRKWFGRKGGLNSSDDNN